MNVAQLIAFSVVAVACVVVFSLMRYPQLRRPQFRGGPAFSTGVALADAVGVPRQADLKTTRAGKWVELPPECRISVIGQEK